MIAVDSNIRDTLTNTAADTIACTKSAVSGRDIVLSVAFETSVYAIAAMLLQITVAAT